MAGVEPVPGEPLTDQQHCDAIEAARKAYMAAVKAAREAGLAVWVTHDCEDNDVVPIADVRRDYEAS